MVSKVKFPENLVSSAICTFLNPVIRHGQNFTKTLAQSDQTVLCTVSPNWLLTTLKKTRDLLTLFEDNLNILGRTWEQS